MTRRRRYWRLSWIWTAEYPIPGRTPARSLTAREYEIQWTATHPPERERTGRTARVIGERAPTAAEASAILRRHYRDLAGRTMRVRNLTVRRIDAPPDARGRAYTVRWRHTRRTSTGAREDAWSEPQGIAGAHSLTDAGTLVANLADLADERIAWTWPAPGALMGQARGQAFLIEEHTA